MHCRNTLLKLLACGLAAWMAGPRPCSAELPIERVPPVAVPAVDDLSDEALFAHLPAVPSVRAQRDQSYWSFQVLPEGLMYKSYLAGVKEPRFAAQWVKDREGRWLWDVALGGRVGIVRYGTTDALDPQGWQIDMEGAAFPRLDLHNKMDLVVCDYRFGIPFTHAIGRHHYKIGYYHISSHLGDEWMIRHPEIQRINYTRDSMVMGYSFYWRPEWRLYAETAYAMGTGECTEPWEFQFGVEYSPAQPTGPRPVPFMAINGHLREEVDYGGNVVVESGWQWRGQTGHLFRMGVQCNVGKSDQFEFYDQYESKVGFGLWYDY